jgi:iron complex outermembrane receptor protein
MNNLKTNLFWAFLGLFIWNQVPASANEYINKSIEELLNVPVTSAAGREQKRSEVAFPMTVITQEDIAKSGARNIPDLFYRVPGMQVRKISGNEYDVSIRAASTRFVANILVLLDGVILFDPLFSGTNWDTLPVTLNEIERIEIIRGPGGVLYGSNAVNGVINIITKKASEKDNYAAQRGGSMSFEQSQLGVGAKVNDKLSVRAFGDYGRSRGFDEQVGGKTFPNSSASDIYGVKAQYDFSKDTSLVIDAKSNHETATDTLESFKRLAYDQLILAQFQQKVNDVYDYSVHIDDNTSSMAQDFHINSMSGKTQHNFKFNLLGQNIASLGGEWQYNKLNAPGPFDPSTTNPNKSQKIMSLFFQDEFRPIDQLILTAGARLTQNSLVTDKKNPLFEPTASIVYLLNEKQSLKALVSRSYRAPSFFDKGANDQNFIMGTADVEPERSTTYEIGWQGLMLNDKLNMDTSLFYTSLKNPILQDNGQGLNFGGIVIPPGSPGSYPGIPIFMNNNGSLQTMGVEWDGTYRLSDDLSIKSDYTYTNARPKADHDPLFAASEHSLISKHQFGLGLDYVKGRWTVDVYGKWISKFTYPVTTGLWQYRKFPSYYKAMLRVAYAFKIPGMKMDGNNAELEVVANDFLDAHSSQGEGVGLSGGALFVEPDVYAGIKIKF